MRKWTEWSPWGRVLALQGILGGRGYEGLLCVCAVSILCPCAASLVGAVDWECSIVAFSALALTWVIIRHFHSTGRLEWEEDEKECLLCQWRGQCCPRCSFSCPWHHSSPHRRTPSAASHTSSTRSIQIATSPRTAKGRISSIRRMRSLTHPQAQDSTISTSHPTRWGRTM